MTFQVDQEFDLLSGITFNNGATLEKAEMVVDGETLEIADPHHFTPEFPCYCNIVLTVKDKDGKSTPYQVKYLKIKPLEDYYEVVIVEADMIEELYPWYNNLQQSTQDFIYPHLLSSYAACNWSQLDNRVHIIMGETPAADDVENI